MDPMNLSNKPPRLPRAELAGVIFLPRSIDKVRATLPGGDPGPYNIPGFTQMMLERLGITAEAFTVAVAAAESDAEVGAFVRQNTTQAKIDDWNGWAATREPRGGDRVAALENYPWLGERPDLRIGLDVLEEDDKRYFAALK
jgi:Domain of unknown function (DUF5069)